MAEIRATLVKTLRDRTGAGIIACKRALAETQGDLEAAVDQLRAAEISKAAKRADRVAAEGLGRPARQRGQGRRNRRAGTMEDRFCRTHSCVPARRRSVRQHRAARARRSWHVAERSGTGRRWIRVRCDRAPDGEDRRAHQLAAVRLRVSQPGRRRLPTCTTPQRPASAVSVSSWRWKARAAPMRCSTSATRSPCTSRPARRCGSPGRTSRSKCSRRSVPRWPSRLARRANPRRSSRNIGESRAVQAAKVPRGSRARHAAVRAES